MSHIPAKRGNSRKFKFPVQIPGNDRLTDGGGAGVGHVQHVLPAGAAEEGGVEERLGDAVPEGREEDELGRFHADFELKLGHKTRKKRPKSFVCLNLQKA